MDNTLKPPQQFSKYGPNDPQIIPKQKTQPKNETTQNVCVPHNTVGLLL